MAVASARVTVATTATRLDTATESDYATKNPAVLGQHYGSEVLVRNRGTASVFVGPSGVTTATGFELEAEDALLLDVAVGDEVWGVVAAGTVLCHVLQVGV